jgi:hypothetical protein
VARDRLNVPRVLPAYVGGPSDDPDRGGSGCGFRGLPIDAQRAYTGPTGPGGGRRPLSKAQLQSTDSLAPGCGAGSDSDADLMCIYASSEIAVHIEMGLTSARSEAKAFESLSSRVPTLQPIQPVRLSEKVESTSGSAGVCPRRL